MDMHTDVHRLEAELGIVIYPGTEVMTDVAGVEFVKSSSGVLVPQPSNNANDPLNWSPFWKAGSITSAIVLGFVQGFGPLSLSSQVPFYMKQFDCTVNQVINFIGVSILVLGFSNFFWVPVATQFGRRPAALFSCLVCLASCIWRAEANTYKSFLGACVLNGFGAGPAETLPPMIISDTIFLNQRGTYMGLYWWAYFGSLMIGPVAAGALSDKYGWRSFWWLNAALFAFVIILILVWMPETKWNRGDDSGIVAPVLQKDKEAGSVDLVEDIVEKHVDDKLGKGKPNRSQFNPIQPFTGSKASFLRDLITPWKLLLFPIVQWTSFAVSWSSSCFLMLNLTQSFVFAAPPYNFSAAAVGYTNLAVFGGALIGLVTAGPFGDWVSAFSTRRNRQVREPEMRLPALWPFCVVLAIGTSIVAVGYQQQWSWKIIVIVGYGLIGLQVASIPPIAITYAIDSYKPVSGDLLVAVTVNKNLWGYGCTQFLIPWILKSGKPDFLTPLLVNTGMTLGFTLLGSLALWYGGKRVRGWTKDSYVHGLTG